jgi:long-subunit acyl-CoA synthetase (AMP-forming)
MSTATGTGVLSGAESKAGEDVTAGLSSMCQAFQATAARKPDEVAHRLAEEGIEWTWGDYAARVRRAAGVLHKLGVRHGDAVAILVRNRPEHLVADMAALHLGASPFSIYATAAPAQIAYVICDSGAKVLISEPVFDPTVAAVEPLCSQLEQVVRLTTCAPELDEDAPPSFDFEACWRAVAPDDVVCLVYTSGTTGPPKGAEITHAGLLANLRGTWRRMGVPERLSAVSFLPYAHILERFMSYYSPAVLGGTATLCPDSATFPVALASTRPSVLVSPPRVWEKLRAKCQALGADPAEFVVAAGLGNLEVAAAGAAPVPVALLEFFQAAGVPLRQGWGMTELSAFGTLTSTDPAENGTCGQPIDGLELRIADDGELLARGPMMIGGYRNLPEKTAELIDADGWLHTGDVGRIDDEGRLTIVDRKKELIISSGGKNMSPSNIEAELKSASPLIGQAVCIGNDRPYNVALLVLDPEVAAGYRDDEALRAEVVRGVGAANARLSRAEQIKRYALLGSEWLPGGDELTPTMKLKRKPIDAKYRSEIDALYA